MKRTCETCGWGRTPAPEGQVRCAVDKRFRLRSVHHTCDKWRKPGVVEGERR